MKKYMLAACLLAILCSGPARAANTLKIGTPEMLADRSLPNVQAVVREAYRRIGLDVTFVVLPTLRELEWADLGQVDGCLTRAPAVAQEYPNLVRVPFPLFHHSRVAVSLEQGLRIRGPEDLSGLRVGACRGSLGTTRYLQQHGVQPVLFNDLDTVFRALREGRIDAVAGGRILLENAAREREMTVRTSRPLQARDYYHWVNRGHADLAPRLAKVLREMYENGATARLLGPYAWLLEDINPDQQ